MNEKEQCIELLNDLALATKNAIDNLNELSVKNKQAWEYAVEHANDLSLKFKLDAAYSQGWEDCKKYNNLK